MLLACNIGNSEIRLGFLDGVRLLDTVSFSNAYKRTADEYACLIRDLLSLRGVSPCDFEDAILASVVPDVTEAVRRGIQLLCGGLRPHLVGTGIRTGLNILTDYPSQLGSDLVASAAGALLDYKPPLILIDFGTAITFSVLEKDGSFIGCSIAPGLRLSAEALSSGASLLPHYAYAAPKKCIGTNTVESLRSGSIHGTAAMVDGMIGRIEEELGYPASCIASGEGAEIILPLCRRKVLRDDSLLLRGLGAIWERNRKKTKKS